MDQNLVSTEPVVFGTGKFGCLDNASAFEFEWRGRVWKTVVHAWQASKFTNHHAIEDMVANARSPHDAERIAREHEDFIIPHWDKIGVPVMRAICRGKLLQHDFVQHTLRETGTRKIADGTEQNVLGTIWMELREKLLSGQLHSELGTSTAQ